MTRIVGRHVTDPWRGVATVLYYLNVPLGPGDWYAVLKVRLDDGEEVWVPAEKTHFHDSGSPLA